MLVCLELRAFGFNVGAIHDRQNKRFCCSLLETKKRFDRWYHPLNTKTRFRRQLWATRASKHINVFQSSFATIYSGFSSISIARIHELLLVLLLARARPYFLAFFSFLSSSPVYIHSMKTSLCSTAVCALMCSWQGLDVGREKGTSEKGNQLNKYYFILSERVRRKHSFGYS